MSIKILKTSSFIYQVHVHHMYLVLCLVLPCEQNWYFLLMKWDDFQIFRPYARDWIRPLTQLIISGPFTGLNYFVIDVIVTIMSWHQVAIPQVIIAIVNNNNLNGLNHSLSCLFYFDNGFCMFRCYSNPWNLQTSAHFVVLNWDLLFSGRNACLSYKPNGFYLHILLFWTGICCSVGETHVLVTHFMVFLAGHCWRPSHVQPPGGVCDGIRV